MEPRGGPQGHCGVSIFALAVDTLCRTLMCYLRVNSDGVLGTSEAAARLSLPLME